VLYDVGVLLCTIVYRCVSLCTTTKGVDMTQTYHYVLVKRTCCYNVEVPLYTGKIYVGKMYASHCVLLQKRCLMYGHHYVLLKMFWYHVGLSLCTTTKKGTSRVYLKCLANFRSEFS
jgi:hypothetical protein